MPNALQFATPVSSFIQGSQLAQQQQQNALAQQAQQFNLQQAQDSAQRQNNLRNAVPGALNGDQGAMNTVMQNDPNIGIKIKQFLLNASEEQKKIAQQNLQEHAQAAAWIDSASNPQEMNQRFQQVRQSMQARGEDMSMFPTQWTPGMSKQVIQGAMTFDQLLAQQKPVSVSANSSLVNPQTGKAIYTAPAAPDNTLKQVQMPDGSVKWMPASQAAGQNAPQPGGGFPVATGPQSNVTGPAVLETLQPQVAAQVKALAEGRMNFPSGYALKSPYWQEMLTKVAQYDPSFDAVNYNKRAQTATAFSKGKQADVVRAVNQTISHMGTLYQTINNLDNMGGAATPLNAVTNFVAEHTGDSRPGLFRQQVQAVSSELRKVFAGSGGGSEAELRSWENSMPLNASKQQQIDYLKSGVDLLGGAMSALDQQYQTGMGKSIMDTNLISDKSKKILRMLGDGSHGQPQQGTQAPQAQPQPAQGGIPQGWSVQVH